MDSPPKLSGETLIVHHIPLVHCQVSGSRQRCGSPLRKSNNPFSCPENLGLIRTTSLPERDVLQREALVYSSLIQTSSSSDAFDDEGMGEKKGGGRGGSMASDTSSFTSSNSEDALPKVPSKTPHHRQNLLRHNPFVLNSGDDDYDDDEDDGDNLNGYLEDSSFHLHGNSSEDGVDLPPFHLHELGYRSGPFHLDESLDKPWSSGQKGAPRRLFSAHLEGLDLLGLDLQRRHGSSGSTLSMDCGEQEWDDEDDEQPVQAGRGGPGCCEFSRQYPESFPDFALGYCSDSSCNSSDGILVNFSTIFNKTNDSVPDKPALNLNSSANLSCTSPSSEPVGKGGAEYASAGGAFYLDLHRSPTEALNESALPPSSSSCQCSSQPQAGTVELDANCNSYHNQEGQLPSDTSATDLTSCMQSQARLVVATQNYYKLVTCDVSSHSTPSPAGSSVTSCSDEHSKGSPTQPTEYFLFRHNKDEEEGPVGEAQEDTQTSLREEEPDRTDTGSAHSSVIEGQVYVNISPPVGASAPGSRLRSRSYDRNLDRTPPPRLGSLERMLSCPVRLSEGSASSPQAPPRVTSFAEIARNKRRGGGGSPSQKSGGEASSVHSHSSGEFSPVLEDLHPLVSSSNWSGALRDSPGGAGREARSRAEGHLSSSADSSPAVLRYSKDQRPTTLPIQPFTFQHQLGKPQPKPVLPLLDEYINHMQARLGSAPSEQDEEDSDDDGRRPRPSPLGSYSPPRSLSCPAPPSHTSPAFVPATRTTPLPPTPPPATRGHCFHRTSLTKLPTLPSSGLSPVAQVEPEGQEEDVTELPVCVAQRQNNVHHLSPQTLKWREYRRKNPLGVEKRDSSSPSSSSLSSSAPLTIRRRAERRNVFDFPPSSHALILSRLNGQSVRCYSDLLPDYFSHTERPPEEFCLSPDATTEESISIDLQQKRALVKAINTAVDLIVAHFGTSRDAGVKAKLGNSSVSPNVAHLILKYLCPAVSKVLQDGLKAYTLNIIIGQRRNHPWSVVEASTQLGPSTRVLHSLYLKVSQYSELTNHSMRLNAFIFGLLNLRSLEFWFNHIYTHEDVIVAHYHPWGFLSLTQGACQPMFEELLLLLQPLSLLPFDLDLLFEPHQLQRGQEHLRCKEQLCSARQGLDQSARSTFQLMRGPAEAAPIRVKEAESKQEGAGLHGGRLVLRREGTWPRMDGAEATAHGGRGYGSECEGVAGFRLDRGRSAERMNGVGGEDVERERRREREGVKDAERDRLRSKQAGWWFQLMQSSQVYIDNSVEGSKFSKWERRRRGGGAEGRRQNEPPPRVGVVEGAEAHHERTEKRDCTGAEILTQSEPPKPKPSWMGSPPESVLAELKRTNETQPEGRGPQTQTMQATQSLRWGRLFGAGTVSKSQRTEPKSSKNQKSRLPSGWLNLDRSVLDLVVGKRSEPHTPNTHTAEIQPSQTQETNTQTTASRSVRALCHHIATEPAHLSFHKGDVLQVLSKAGPDWLLCASGHARGLVPIVYVTLNDEESIEPHPPQAAVTSSDRSRTRSV